MQLDYVVFMSLLAISVMTQFLTLNYWGKLSDYVGNRLILVYTSMLLPVLPVLWLFSTNLMYLCFIQMLGGLTWAGFSLCVNNSIYELIEPKLRPNFCAFYNVVCHTCIACGALLGGWLASLDITTIDFILFQTNFANSLFTVFLISGLCRLTVVVMLIKYIHDEPIPFSTRRTYIRVTRLFPGLMIDWIVKKKDR
jgi:MFS family permease